jgi:hypothetical protein
MANTRSTDNFGLDKELKEKEEAKRDLAMEAKVQAFLEQLSGRKLSGGFLESLKDGQILCLAMNKVKPGVITNMSTSGKPFSQMENIAAFLKCCRTELHMSEHDLFTTPDLFDERSPVNVCSGIVAFSRAASKQGFAGPSIAPKESSPLAAVKRWSLSARNSGVSLLNMGSSGVMDKSHIHIDRSRNITFGADATGKAVGSADVTKLSMGSAGVMDKQHTHIDRSRNVTFGADASGKAVGSADVTKLAMGSAGTMDKSHTHIDRSRNVTFGADATRALPAKA